MKTRSLLRVAGETSSEAGSVELFFDLVFVFAVTQVSHILIEHTSLEGFLETLLLILAVWWIWIYNAWISSWLDPEQWSVRWMLIALMLAALVMSAAIPEAFGPRGMVFAAAYVISHLGRTVFMLLAQIRRRPDLAIHFCRVLIWLSVAAVCWILGGLVAEHQRLLWWAAAFGIEYLGVLVMFWVPGLGKGDPSTWDIPLDHLAHRVSLFIIIVLGESIIVTGSALSKLDWNTTTWLAFLAAFSSTVLMWVIYFRRGPQSAGDYIARSGNPVAVAIVAYTWVQVPLVVGIVLTAVGDALVLDAPLGPTPLAVALLICGGPAVFLIGTLLFHRSISRTWIPWRIASVGAIALIFAAHYYFSPLALSWLTSAALLSAAVVDARAPGQQQQAPLADKRAHRALRKHAPNHDKDGTET